MYLHGGFGSSVIWAEKMKAWDLLPIFAMKVLMRPFFHSTALLPLDRGSRDGAETISQVVKMDYVCIMFR